MQKTNKKKEKEKQKYCSRVPEFSRSQLRLALSLSLSPPPPGGRGHGGRVCVFRHGCFRVQQLFPCSTAALQINRRRRVSAAFFCSALCLQNKKDQRVEQQRFTFFDCKVFFSALCVAVVFLFWSLPIFPSFVCVVCLSSATTRIHLLFSSSRLFHFIIPQLLLLCFWCCLFSEVWKKHTIACWMVK